MTIHVIHENIDWSQPLFDHLLEKQAPYFDMDMSARSIDLMAEPPTGIFYNRMSASSHTRGHRYAPEMTSALLSWIEAAGAPVLNGSNALRLELNKAVQYGALKLAGINVPKTIVCEHASDMLTAFDRFGGAPVITKHNRAGKGLGVQLFKERGALETYVNGADFDPSVDGLTLIQRYIEAPKPFITRMEFIGQEFLYAVRVDTSEGFELCPADFCTLEEAAFCPADSNLATDTLTPVENTAKFQIDMDFAASALGQHLIPKCISVMKTQKLDVSAFEFITDADGTPYIYDINTNTNYNSDAEAVVGISAMERLATYLIDVAAEHSDKRAA